EVPSIANDGEINLIYVQELVMVIINEIRSRRTTREFKMPYTATKKVSEVLSLLLNFKETYFEKGEIPVLNSTFELNLFNTYRSYIDHKTYFPVKFTQHTDPRGAFVEVIRLGIGGQVSFSTTV